MNTNHLVWRAPVPPLLSSNDTAASAVAVTHNVRVQRPYLAQLLVACRVLRVTMETTFTAACLWHRYALATANQAADDDDELPWRVAAVIFIACKTQEDHRRLRDLINLVHMIRIQDISGIACCGSICNVPVPHRFHVGNPEVGYEWEEDGTQNGSGHSQAG